MMFFGRYFPVARDTPQSIIEHLEEFRHRVLWAIAGFFLATVVGFWQQHRRLFLLMRPAGLTHLIALTVLQPMLVKFKVAPVFGLALAVPCWLRAEMLLVAAAMVGLDEPSLVLARWAFPGRELAPVTSEEHAG